MGVRKSLAVLALAAAPFAGVAIAAPATAAPIQSSVSAAAPIQSNWTVTKAAGANQTTAEVPGFEGADILAYYYGGPERWVRTGNVSSGGWWIFSWRTCETKQQEWRQSYYNGWNWYDTGAYSSEAC